jgi:N-glycosylase/DNA lyase
MENALLPTRLEKTVLKVYQSIDKTNSHKWPIYSEEALWYELVACILGSQVPFEIAQKAANNLQSNGLLEVNNCLQNSNQFEAKIVEILSSKMLVATENSGNAVKYRYPKLRANHIRRTAESIYRHNDSIKDILLRSQDSFDARIKIINASVGIGPKQSSLFLRNVGYADNVAILDTHVLYYMFLLGLLDVKVRTVSTIGQYREIEEKLFSYTKKLGTNLAYLDTAIWVTMRVFQRESAV